MIANWTLREKHQRNFNQNSVILIEENAFENVPCKMAASFPALNVLICRSITIDKPSTNLQPHKPMVNSLHQTRSLSLAQSKLRLCSANHRPGYWSNPPCDWPSTVWDYSEWEKMRPGPTHPAGGWWLVLCSRILCNCVHGNATFGCGTGEMTTTYIRQCW